LSGLLPLFVGDLRYDATIDQWDKFVFGISPSVWMERLAHPIFTEFLYLFYAIYFILPFILVIIIYRNKEYKELEITMFSIFLNYYGAYICYFFVPVEGPRYYLANEHTLSLDGIFLSQTIRDVINSYEPSTLDCFPSLHTSTLVLIILLASRYYRKLFVPFILMGVVIIFSLVYLRYHYIIDILGGIIWAFISFYASAWIYKKYSNVFHQHIIH
jgi:membrane-associated phospholipid phosphatase